MFGTMNYGVFVISGIMLNLTPGADTMYILGRSMSNGKRAGIMSALGISTGCLVHTTLAALGLSMILAESEIAFDIIKYLGAGYLIYLGIRSFLSKSAMVKQNEDNQKVNTINIYFQGILTNVLNPKVALFFLAFLPQFIQRDNSYGVVPFLLLGLTFIFTGTTWDIILALFSSHIMDRINEKLNLSNILNKLTGVLFIGLGLNLLRAKIGR